MSVVVLGRWAHRRGHPPVVTSYQSGLEYDDVHRRLEMFVQVVQGRTSDPQALDAATERWMRDLAPGATGWLGTTGGITEDGRAIAVVRFESEEAARRNGKRPEQQQWGG